MRLSFDPTATWYWNGVRRCWQGLETLSFDDQGKFREIRASSQERQWNELKAGAFLFPGLIDMHVHLGEDPYPRHRNRSLGGAEGYYPVIVENLKTAVQHGVTTLRDMGSIGVSKRQFDIWKAHKERQGAVYPRVFSAGSFLTRLTGHAAEGIFAVPGRLIEGIEDGAAWISFMAREAVTHIKVMNDPILFTLEEMTALSACCSSHGLPLAVHAYTDEGANIALRSGAQTIEHSADYSEAVIGSICSAGTAVCTTYIAAIDAATAPGRCALGAFDEGCDPAVFDAWFASASAGIPRLWSHGTRMILGSDAGCPGTDFASIWREIFALNTLGIPIEECVHAATVNAAIVLNARHLIGAIADGLMADFAIYGSNPLLLPTLPHAVYIGGRQAVSEQKPPGTTRGRYALLT